VPPAFGVVHPYDEQRPADVTGLRPVVRPGPPRPRRGAGGARGLQRL